MDKLINYIKKNLTKDFDNTYLTFKLVSVVYDKSTSIVTLKFIYTNGDVTKAMKQKIIEYISAYYDNKFVVDCKLKKSYLDEDAIQEFVYRTLLDNCKSILNFEKSDVKASVSEDGVKIECTVVEQFYDFLVNKNYDRLLIEHLNNNFFGNFEIKFLTKTAMKSNDILQEKEREMEKMIASTTIAKPKYIKVDMQDTFAGVQMESSEAMEINSVKKPQPAIQICGTISYFLKKSFMSKKKDAEGNAVEREYFSFTLNDGTGRMNCVCFPTKADFEAVSTLTEGREIIALGDVEDFNGRINFKVKSMAYCKLPERKEEVIEEKGVNPEYYYIKPEPYMNISQDNFLVMKKEPNEFLKQNEVVVFDFETTGLDHSKNEIIEIGAVKMVNGEIVETFSCFVKPKQEIPDEITKLTGITNDMVKDAHTIDKVIPDFYKFCYGCVIIAYNIDFDYKFLNFQATKLGYKFNNRQIDALYLARQNVVGAKNFQLKNICAKLGVSLEGAHRAVNDTVATAEVVKLISDNVSPK